MNSNDDKNPQDSLDANLSKLICKDNLPPAPTEDEKEAMLARLGKKQSALVTTSAPAPRKVLPLVLGGLAAAAAIAALIVAGDLFPDPTSPSPSAGNPSQPEVPAPDPEGDVEEPEPLPQAIAYEAMDETRRIELRDGSTVIAERGTRFTEVTPRSLRLDEGSLYVLVTKADTPLEVITPQGKAEALGTRFVVSAKPEDTRVAVAQGKVRLVGHEDDRPLELVRGEEGILAPTELIRRPAPRLSHLVNWARESLRQEERLEADLVRNGLVVLDPNGQEAKLSLREYTLDVHIENGVARTTIDQTFFNHLQSNTEGTFYFPLPPRAAVSRLAMYVNGIRNEGGMVERHRGQQIYNDIKYQNRDPALLEQLEGNLYKLRIFPLEPRQEKRIFLSFTQTVDELYRTLRYWCPMDHTHENAGRVKIQVRVRNGGQFDAKSSTHDFKRSIENGDLVLTYEASNIKPDQDLLLNLIPKAAGKELAETATLQRDEQSYLHTRIRPELEGQAGAEPRQWFILNDTSASRTTADLQAQAHLVERLLAEADDHDKVAIANLNIDVQRLTKDLVPLRSMEAAAAVERIRKAERLGGTNLAAGIAAARAWIADSGATNPHIVYLGDGLATDGAVTTNELTDLLDKNVPLLGLAVGKKADLSFLRSAADATGGGAFLMNPDEDLNWRVFDMLASLNTPRLTGIEFAFSGTKKEIHAYSDRTTLAAGEALTIVASTAGELPQMVTVRGTLNGQPWEKEIALDPTREDAGFIPRFWAQRHLEELLKEGEEHREEVVRLSKKHYVATPFTSLIVLENDKMYRDYKVEKGRKDHWAAYDAPDKIPVVREPISWIVRNWNQQPTAPAPDAIKIDPKTADEILDTIQPTPMQPNPPSLGYGGWTSRFGWGNNAEIRRDLYLAEGFTNLGRFEQAQQGYLGVLRKDRFNSDARRGLERIHALESDYYRAAYDETRARLLSQVDAAWELSVPPVDFGAASTYWYFDGGGGGGGGGGFGDFVSNDFVTSTAIPIPGEISHFHSLTPPLPAVTMPTPAIPLPRPGGIAGGESVIGNIAGRGNWPVNRQGLNTALGPEVLGKSRLAGFGYRWYPVYPLVGNLTTLIPGLVTSNSDRASAVEMTLGREQRGSITDHAAALVRAAEGKRRPVRIDGTITTPDGRLKSSTNTPLFLGEEILSDGKSLYHIYRELGFAARRPVTPSNLALIQSTVPHWPPSLQELESRWVVSLVAEHDDWFEIALVNPDNKEHIHHLKITSDGRLLESRQFKGEELLGTLTFSYQGNTVVMESGSGNRGTYEAVEIGVAEALFEADLKDLVTLDLPLRRPAYYAQKLTALDANEKDQRKQLLRYLTIARLWEGGQMVPAGTTSTDVPLTAATAWSLLIQLGEGTTPLFDHRTLAAAVNIQSVVPEHCEFLAHLKEVTTLGSGYPQRAQVETFVQNWPESPFVMALAGRCQDWQVWIPLLDIPDCQGAAITRIAAAAGAQNSSERANLADRVASILIDAAKAGRPVAIPPQVARFLGREQQSNASWRKLAGAYRELGQTLADLEPHRVAAILDLAIKEKDDALQQRCLDQLLPGIKARKAPMDLVVLAEIFISHGQHEQATELYQMAMAQIEDPSVALLQKAAAAIREMDEKQSIVWQHRALRKLGEGNYATDKQSLASQYSQLMVRAWDSGDAETAREVAREGYDLLPEQHSLIKGIAEYLHREGNKKESWRWLSTILDRHPKNAEACGAIGDWYQDKAMFLKAAGKYAEAHSYDSAHPQWLVKQASVLYQAGKFEEADEVYQELSTTDWAHQLKSQVPAQLNLPLVRPGSSGRLSRNDPGADWSMPAFDDSEWNDQNLSFAAADEIWNQPFWTRQEFEIGRLPRRIDLRGQIHGVECQVYLNGKLVESIKHHGGSDRNYHRILKQEFLESLQPGHNVLAIRYEKTGTTPRAWFSLDQVFPKVK